MKIGFLFPGYGTQFVGMGKDLYDESRRMQELFEQASNCLGINFIKLCFASSDVELAHISNAYVALFLTHAALYSVLQEEGITPHQVAGHGVGEYAALFAAGSISFPDALYLLNKFATFYCEEFQGTRFSVLHVKGADDAQLERFCAACTKGNEYVAISVHNAHDDHYVAGTRKAVEAFQVLCHTQEGVECVDLDEGHGLHAPSMDAVLERWKSYLPKVDFKDLAVPMINCVDAVQVLSGEPAKYSIIRQINNPILWSQVLTSFANCDVIITVGPGDSFTQLVQERHPEKRVLGFSKKEDLAAIKELMTPTVQTQDDDTPAV